MLRREPLVQPSGDVVFEAPRGEEAVDVATADLDQLLSRAVPMHPFYNRNPTLYEPIADQGR